MRFNWDDAKARENLRKHGVSFEERFVLLGLSSTLRVLTVVHGYIENDEIVRLISARKATRSERTQYGARWKQ